MIAETQSKATPQYNKLINLKIRTKNFYYSLNTFLNRTLDYINTVIIKAKLKFANKLINYYSQLNELVNQQNYIINNKNC